MNAKKLEEEWTRTPSITQLSHQLRVSIKTVWNYLVKHNLDRKAGSQAEKTISKWLEDLNINFVPNTRSIITPLELDFYLPDHNLAIEYNGIYWHCEKSNGVGRNYHLKKTELCESKGIQLLHIFENEDMDLWKSMILSKIGHSDKIFARKCAIADVSRDLEAEFLKDNHIQGNNTRSLVRKGLFYNDELVSLMTFGHPRFDKSYEWELLRFCNKQGVTVIGGASRLFKHSGVTDCISYANRRFSTGKLYENLGFKKIRVSDPNFFYTKNYQTLESRMKYQKYRLKEKLEVFSEELSGWQNMMNNGFDRIWDSGNLVYSH